MNNTKYLRIYDDKLDLLYESSLHQAGIRSKKVARLLRKSKMFLHVDNILCYRILPDLESRDYRA